MKLSYPLNPSTSSASEGKTLGSGQVARSNHDPFFSIGLQYCDSSIRTFSGIKN